MSDQNPPKLDKDTTQTANADSASMSLTTSKFTLGLALKFINVLLVIIAVTAPATLYCLLRTPPSRYFGHTAEGHVVELKPWNEDAGSEADMSQWVTDALTETLTFDFLNAKKHLTKNMRLYFTKTGAEQLKNAIVRAKILETVEGKTLILKTVITESPLVMEAPVTVSGEQQYIVKTAVLLTYYAGQEATPQAMPAQVTLVRTPFEQHPGGLAIESIQISSHLGD